MLSSNRIGFTRSYHSLHKTQVVPRIPVNKLSLRKQSTPQQRIQPKSFLNDLNTTSYFIGKGIILFTMFYCTLNWAYYRGLRKEYEQEEKDDKDKKKK